MTKISRRTFVIGTAAASATTWGGYTLWNMKPRRPNIILFIADDMNYRDASSKTNPLLEVPNLDALKASSQDFTNAFVTTAGCSASRGSLITGTYYHKNGIILSHDSLSKFYLQNNLISLFKEEGYYTGFIGKWGFQLPPKNLFDFWRGYQTEASYLENKTDTTHITDEQTEQALQFIDNVPRPQPFLLIVSYTAPGMPFVPQAKFQKLYANADIQRDITDTENDVKALPELVRSSRGRRDYERYEMADNNVFQRRMKDYYRLVSGMDESIGIITSKLEHPDTKGRNCIIFTSDHGMMHGSHGLLGKWCMYEDSIRVPLMIKPPEAFYPDITPAQHSGMALNIDIAPTLLSIAKIPACSSMQGKSLVPLIKDPKKEGRKGFYYDHPYIRSGLMVGVQGIRTNDWKYTSYYVLKRREEVLFDLKADPHERSNLARNAEYKNKLIEMRLAMKHGKHS